MSFELIPLPHKFELPVLERLHFGSKPLDHSLKCLRVAAANPGVPRVQITP